MTQEEKQLLIKDLSGRLPYGVIVNTPKGDGYLCSINQTIFGNEYGVNIKATERDYFNDDECDIKPYLRPISSMTEEESNELESITFPLMEKDWDGNENPACIRWIDIPKYMDFILSHHFDYRGLIEKGLALEAHKDMYNIKF